MKNYRWVRALAIVLVIACMVGVVSATSYTYTLDLSGDDKVDVFDLQWAVDQGKDSAHKAAILTAIMGNPDELHPNAEGVYEIYTATGLYNMVNMINKDQEKGITFQLMKDIDMQGKVWQTTQNFNGILEGNGHVISNVNVTNEIVISGTNYGQGFFGKIGQNGAVRNLKLENVNVILTENSKAKFIGLLTGSLTGEITNCTTVGTVIDPRTTLSAKTYIGTLTGCVENVSTYTVPGISVTDESILMTAESEKITAISGKSQKVLCKMGMEFGTLAADSPVRKLGIAGWAPDYTNFETYNWQDISGTCTVTGGTGVTYDLEDPILTDRRQAAVDKMHEITTVEWTPSNDLTIHYYKSSYDTKTWKAGNTYRGMPYNHGAGSLERFEYWMSGTDSMGRLVTKTSLPTTAYYYSYAPVYKALSNYNDTSLQTPLTYTYANGNTYDLLPGFTVSDQPLTVGDAVQSADHAGFSRYIGNDCSQAIAWAWREVVSNEVATGGTVVSGVTQMAPLISYNEDGSVNTNYQTLYGVLPVGGLVPYSTSTSTSTNDNGWNDYCAGQGETAFFNAYAQASRGDALIVFNNDGGHSRMIAYDPICIRSYNGTIQEKNSYIITHEQGRPSSGDGWSSTCYADCVYTFDKLYNYKDYTNIGSAGYYMPMTLPAFHDVNSKAVTSAVTYKDGVVKSNFYISSVVMDGQEVFPAVGQHSTTNKTTRVGEGYRDARVQENLNTIFGDITGKTVTVKLSNGDVYTVDGTTGAVTKN